MAESFGARLRQRREQQQITLSTIAEQTKIKQSLLESLERDDVSHWPSGIFRRAFIRAYAHAIGLAPDVVVREFLEIYPDPAEVVEPVPAIAAALDGPSSGGAPIRLRYLVASAVGSLSRRRARTTPEPEPIAADRVPITSERVPTAEAPPATEIQEPRPAPVVEPDAIPRVETPVPTPPDAIDLPAVAELCTQLGKVGSTLELPPLLQEASRILDAPGLVVWVWDRIAAELYPALAHGYSERVLAQLPGLPRDANNATAAAFREAQTCVVPGDDTISGALVLPLLTPSGCVGVLALELQKRNEERESVRAAGTIIAAQLAALIGAASPSDAAERVRSAG
jgi:transcriptional regulator with XRE-family HTH domain